MRNDITGIQALAPVTRRIDRPVETIIEALDAPTPARGRLETRSGWTPVASSPVPAWEARARLATQRTVLRRWTVRGTTPVRLEVAAWSGGASELSVWPIAPGFARWGRRHQDRYFDAAHAAADAAALDLAGGRRQAQSGARLIGRLQPVVPAPTAAACARTG